MQYIKHLIFFICYCFLLNFSLSGQDYEVAPVKLNYSVEPGEASSKVITIKNHANKNQTFIISLGDFMPDSKGKINYYPANSTKFSCAQFLSVSPSFFEINPNEEKEIMVTLQAAVGDYTSRWAMLYIRTAQEQTSFSVDKGLSAGLMVSSQIAVMISQSPKSNVNFFATINRLNEITNESDSVRTFTANIENLGDKITKCKVYLIAANLITAEETFYDPIEVLTYPKSSLTVVLTLPYGLPKGKYSLSAVLDYGSTKTLEGTQTIIDVH
ncbi:MAG: hypothetical protein KAT68_00980 [Bacteroidales bacterium]|nr:hypothetical protein [Bacteroidales bacterium]